MKIIITLIFILLFSCTADALDYQVSVYPTSNHIEVIKISVADTLTVTINNLSFDDVDDFFLTVNSDDSILVIENEIDGNTNPVIAYEVTDGIIYPNQLSTSWIIGTFSQSISLKFYTLNSASSHLTISGKHPFAFFGILEPITPNCCVGIRGNIDGDSEDNIDISDLVYFISYSFGTPNGSAPPCFEEADVDASGTLDISDIVYLVNYMFSVGSKIPPLDCP